MLLELLVQTVQADSQQPLSALQVSSSVALSSAMQDQLALDQD